MQFCRQTAEARSPLPLECGMAMKRKRDTIASVDESESQELDPFANLPSDIITNHILLQLPIKSIATCKCVCRTWNALISDPLFAKLHLECASLGVMMGTLTYSGGLRTLHLVEPEKYEIECNTPVKLLHEFKLHIRDAKLAFNKRDETMDWVTQWPCRRGYDSFGVVNSCNGLLCLHHSRKGYPLVVCNPVTGEFITLPDAIITEKFRGQVYAGFGFQPKMNEYKVVRIWMKYVTIKEDVEVFDCVVVEMHTLGTPTWRNVVVDPGFSISKLQFPTYLNGAIHWISFDGGQRSILCFTFESERFQSFPFPPLVIGDNRIRHTSLICMTELGGFLYICDASSCNSCVMWLMKEYSVGESWTQIFSIDYLNYKPNWPYGLCWPVHHSKKSAAMLMQHSGNCFVYYDPEKYGFKVFRVVGTRSTLFGLEAIPHIPSFISLKDVLKGDNTKVLRRTKLKSRGKKNEVIFSRSR